MQVVVSNLVDSNVFLRSVILSLEYFASRQSRILALGCSYDLSTCKLRAFLRHNTLRLLRDLMTVISVDEVRIPRIQIMGRRPCSVHHTLCTIHHTQKHSAPYTTHKNTLVHTLYTTHYTLHTIHYTQNTLLYTLHTQCTMHHTLYFFLSTCWPLGKL
jgi:hypothetical protein